MDSQLTGLSLETHSDWFKSVLRRYNVSWERGFVPEKAPLLEFPGPYFLIWDEIFNDLTSLIQKRQLREAVQKMPLLDHTRLDSLEEWQRAHMVLSAIGTGYVWQNGANDALNVIPKCLAIPWVAVAQHIGGCPALSYCNIVFTNWKIIDNTRPLDVSNVDTQFSFTGDKGEHWFYMVSLQCELEAVPGIRSVVAAQKAVMDNDKGLLEISLISLKESIEKVRSSAMSRISERCDPEFFYTKLRPFFFGSKNNKALPDGVIYEGVSSEPLQFSGGSGSQSSILHTFDAALGVVHPKEKDGKKTHLETMLQHMPRGHREFISFVKMGPSICEYIKRTNDDHLKDLFNACLESLRQFRSYHIQVVARYVTIQAAKAAKNNNVKVIGKHGTGGTEVMSFLKSVRSDTLEAKIEFS